MSRPYVWATLEDFAPPRRGEKIVGRQVANRRFLNALLRHGKFDEYHFFLMGKNDKEAFLEAHAQALEETGARDRVKVFCRADLPGQIRSVPYLVFHLGDHLRYFNALCHFRNAHGAMFPVSAFIHSLNYPGDFSVYQEMVLGGVTPGDCIVCSSSAGRQTILRYLEQAAQRLHRPIPSMRLEVIPYGIDGEPFRRISKEEARDELGIPPNRRMGIYVGRFSDYDKMDLFPLLQAFHLIYREGEPWELVLAGSSHSGDYLEMLKLWAQALNVSHWVRFVVDPTEEEKIRWLRAADFFVSPADNFQETFGITLIEAMAAGIALVVSDFNGYRDLVTEDVGFRVRTIWGDVDLPPTLSALVHDAMVFRYQAQSICVDVDHLAQTMLNLFMDRDLCEAMGRNARKRFEAEYDEAVFISRLEGLWLEMHHSFGLEAAGRGVTTPLYPDYFRVFSHYATRLLSMDDVVQASPFAQAFASMGLRYPLLGEMEQFVDHTYVESVIQAAVEPVRVGDLMLHAPTDNSRALYHLLWMLKHGLLQLCPEGSALDSRGKGASI